MNERHDHTGLEYILARIIQDFMQFMHETGLSRPQINALLHIYHAGECRVSEVAALSDASPAAASQLVERLVQQGLVERTEDPANRRVKRVRLTGKSLKLIGEGVASNRFLLELMAQLPEKRRKMVLEAFDYLAEASRNLHITNQRKVEQHAQNA
jgi:DNA-binding MarR family transcriptional regulator